MKVEINERLHNKRIIPEEGYVLTDWDKEDIMTFTFSEEITAPLFYDETKLYEITVEEKDRLLEEQEEERKRREEGKEGE